MFEVTTELESIYLYPAAIAVPNKQTLVHTILGSCVAVCLFDTRLRIGGINHFMLPFWNGQGLASPKYGNIAIEKLYQKLTYNGARPENLIVKLFGGGEVLESVNQHFNVGQRNIMLAYEMLDQLKLKIVAESTGGRYGRKIIFNTGTGEVTQKYVKSS